MVSVRVCSCHGGVARQKLTVEKAWKRMLPAMRILVAETSENDYTRVLGRTGRSERVLATFCFAFYVGKIRVGCLIENFALMNAKSRTVCYEREEL